MKNILKELYNKIIFYAPEQIEAGKRLDEEIGILLEPYKARLNEREAEELQNMVYTAVYSAEYEGFCIGAKSVTGLLLEIMSI